MVKTNLDILAELLLTEIIRSRQKDHQLRTTLRLCIDILRMELKPVANQLNAAHAELCSPNPNIDKVMELISNAASRLR